MGTLTWTYAFLLWHSQPDFDSLELSLKTRSFTGLVSKGGLSKTKGPLNATICYLLVGIALIICFVHRLGARILLWHYSEYEGGENKYFGIC